MNLASRLEQMEQALAACGDYERQCPHSLRFLGQVLPCPNGGCWSGCGRAKEILIARVELMAERVRDIPNGRTA
jgi:hypothetical protein